jgi:hypothetical protein
MRSYLDDVWYCAATDTLFLVEEWAHEIQAILLKDSNYYYIGEL